MLSRTADSIFWLSRYLERTDHLLRVSSTHYILSLDTGVNTGRSWATVLQQFTNLSNEDLRKLEHNPEDALKKLLIDASNNNSLKSIIHKARENARGAQDHITKEVWEQVNQMFHAVNDPQLATRLQNFQSIAVMKELIQETVLYVGWTDITMPRGTGWQFMNLGRYLERVLQTINLIVSQLEDMKVTDRDVSDILQWRYLLLAFSGYELHLKTYRSINHDFNALHQVVLNENFSHSILYSLSRIKGYLSMIISANDQGADSSLLLRNIGRIHSGISFLDPNQLNQNDITEVLKKLRYDLNNFSRSLELQFFSYT